MGHSAVKMLAFVKRDIRIESSYKTSFLLSIASCVFPVLTFYFIGRLVSDRTNSLLKPFGGDYFAFALVGVAVTQYFNTALRVFAGSIRRAQMTGVLEAILSTQTSPAEVVLYSSLYAFLGSTLYAAVVFTLGGLLGVEYGRAAPLSVLIVLVLAIAVFTGLGLLSATAILILKQGDPIEMFVSSVSALLGGAFFPIAVMPPWLRSVAYALPTTHALSALRGALFQGSSLAELWKPLTVLTAMAIVLVPGSLWGFSRVLETARRDGSLMHY